MSYNARNDEIRDNITRMRREWEAQRGALATVRPPPHRARRPGGRRSRSLAPGVVATENLPPNKKGKRKG
jgi:hypothetical protein